MRVPIRKVTGEYGFNQVFFTDARIPASTLMLEEGKGWQVAMKTLEYERGVQAGQGTSHWAVSIQIDDLIDDLRGFERDGEPLFQGSFGEGPSGHPHYGSQGVGAVPASHAVVGLTSDFPMGFALVFQISRHRMGAPDEVVWYRHAGGEQFALYG